MELSGNSAEKSGERAGPGYSRHFFWLGVAFDTVGAMALFTGAFADFFFYDLLLYLGSVILFISFLWWVIWYSSNLELSPEEALQRPCRVPSSPTGGTRTQTVRQRFSFSVGNVPATLARNQQGRRRRRLLQSGASLSGQKIGRVQKPLAEEDQAKDGMKSVKESGDAEDWGRQALSPELEAVKSLEVVCVPSPDAGPLGPEAERLSTHLVQPVFAPSPIDQPLSSTDLVSENLPVVPLSCTNQRLASLSFNSLPIVSSTSTSQPPVTLASSSLPNLPLSSTGQLLDTLASKIQPAAPVTSQSHPLVPLAWQSHPLVSLASQSLPLVPVASQYHLVASQSYPLVSATAHSHLPGLVSSKSHALLSVAARSHLQVPVASGSNFRNLSPASQTQPPSVQTSKAQALATQVSLIQLLPAPSFQTQPVDLQVPLAVQDFQGLCDTQQAPKSSALVQEIAFSQSSHAQEPPTGQELSQEVSDTVSLLPKSLALATEGQQSVPQDTVPAPTAESSHPP